MWVAGLVPNKMGGFERMCAEFARQGEERNVDVQAYLRAWLARAKVSNRVRLTVDVDPMSFF